MWCTTRTEANRSARKERNKGRLEEGTRSRGGKGEGHSGGTEWGQRTMTAGSFVIGVEAASVYVFRRKKAE